MTTGPLPAVFIGGGPSMGGGFPGGSSAALAMVSASPAPFDGVRFLVPEEYRTQHASSSDPPVHSSLPMLADRTAVAHGGVTRQAEDGGTGNPLASGLSGAPACTD